MFISCGGDNKEYVNLSYNKETSPSMQDDSVIMFISDSGIIRYKMEAKKWLIFDRSKDPHYFFPEGIYLEQFDTLFNKQVTIIADTAWNYTIRKIWRLKGHVFIKNIQDETFSTEEVFWDEKKQEIYSDKYIKINRPNKMLLQGVGFTSNSDMTRYKIYKPFDSDLIFEENTNPTP